MKNVLKQAFALMLVILISIIKVSAQETTSEIQGTVTTGTAGLAGVTITAIHQPTGTKYVTTTYAKWSTNVGNDFNKTFGDNVETSYTPGNFFTYWAAYKIPEKMAQAKKNIPKDLFDLFSNLSGEYGVPLDYIITTAYIESSFNPKAGNTRYKGMFALSQAEFNKYYPSGDIFNIEQNSRVGVQVLKEKVKQARKLFNQYKSYFK